jgi:uncharacterized phage protein gp47/JayE
MPSWGVQSTGFIPATLADLRTALNAAWRSVFGDQINVDPQSRDGQEIGIISEPLSDLWQGGEAIAQLFNPNGAVDQGLDNLCAITGTKRKAATKSTVTLALTGVPTTTVGAGKVASVTGTAAKFTTLGSVVIAAKTAWANTSLYYVADRIKNGGNIYECTIGGISAGAGGPTGTAADIVDGAAHWRYLGAGTGAVDSPAESTVTGPVQGYSGTITNIDTAVGGWNGVNNVLDASPGMDDELNPALRIRRVQELGGQGVSALPALRSLILKLVGVTTCTIFENTTDATVDTVPPHSFEAMVEGGADADILNIIGKNRPAGIGPHGSTSGTVVDAAGVSRTNYFSRPTSLPLYVAVFVTKDPQSYPSDGDTQIKDVIANLGNQQPVGRDGEGTEIAGWLFPRRDVAGLGVPGVLYMTSPLLVDTASTPATTEAVATARQRIAFDTGRITVVSIDGTP